MEVLFLSEYGAGGNCFCKLGELTKKAPDLSGAFFVFKQMKYLKAAVMTECAGKAA
jgi:hypothetical protein